MARFIKGRKDGLNQAPGSLIFLGSRKMEQSTMDIFTYGPSLFSEDTLEKIPSMDVLKTKKVHWLNLTGLHDTELFKRMGEQYHLHPLILEDILNTSQRPKLEESPKELFLVLKMFHFDEEQQGVVSEQLSLVLGKNYLLTFQEAPGDVFESVRERIRNDRGRVRQSGADYLLFALADAVVDSYYSTMERIGTRIEAMEESILNDDDGTGSDRINQLRKELIYLRKSVQPATEALFQLARIEHPLIKEETRPYLRDLHDHIKQIAESIDHYRDLLKDQMDLLNSRLNNKLNRIMKTLTILSAVFIPITFVAGVYGTNFHYIPELSYPYAYYIFLGAELCLAGILLFIFKKKKWW